MRPDAKTFVCGFSIVFFSLLTPGTDSSGCRDLVVLYRKEADLCRMTSILLVFFFFAFPSALQMSWSGHLQALLPREQPLQLSAELPAHSHPCLWSARLYHTLVFLFYLLPCASRSALFLLCHTISILFSWASLLTQMVKNLPAMQDTWVWPLGWEDPLEKGTCPLGA